MLVKKLNVWADIEHKIFHVGTLAASGRDTLFEYDENFRQQGLELSPLHLPTSIPLYTNHGYRSDFPQLPGPFCDSLADGWGIRLMDRWFETQGFHPNNVVERLSYMGRRSMGALRYEPEKPIDGMDSDRPIDIALLAEESNKISTGDTYKVINDIMIAGGSSGGARPKALIGLNQTTNKAVHGVYELPEGYEHYVIKFQHSNEPASTGALEYVYSLMAKQAGINIPETLLLKYGKKRYFAIKRFDRKGNQKLHMHTLGGLLHSDFRIPGATYDVLFEATDFLTNDKSQLYEVFRRMAFNVYSNNRDDHMHNFSFLMDSKGKWFFSPAYDLTYAKGPNGYHTMDIEGEKNPKALDLLRLAKKVGLKPKKCQLIIEQIKDTVSQFKNIANQYSIDKKTQKLVGGEIDKNLSK